jgi:hypothetical protein
VHVSGKQLDTLNERMRDSEREKDELVAKVKQENKQN